MVESVPEIVVGVASGIFISAGTSSRPTLGKISGLSSCSCRSDNASVR